MSFFRAWDGLAQLCCLTFGEAAKIDFYPAYYRCFLKSVQKACPQGIEKQQIHKNNHVLFFPSHCFPLKLGYCKGKNGVWINI